MQFLIIHKIRPQPSSGLLLDPLKSFPDMLFFKIILYADQKIIESVNEVSDEHANGT